MRRSRLPKIMMASSAERFNPLSIFAFSTKLKRILLYIRAIV
ncbi:hypothetical protein D515_00085 [Grimontia indica]|uniref:Uncharacterized protein n=1 Tax=Grimontia indica TaxID=1056512 RepID=R1IWW9_9GAMM|nr:hypothetical protein D515_00085 [Grimontia indica]